MVIGLYSNDDLPVEWCKNWKDMKDTNCFKRCLIQRFGYSSSSSSSLSSSIFSSIMRGRERDRLGSLTDERGNTIERAREFLSRVH